VNSCMKPDPHQLHPPKARFVLRIGVTGHRPSKLPDDTGALQDSVRRLLRQIRDTLSTLRSEPAIREAYRKEPPQLRVISPLAEGADRLVAEEALAQDYELQCPLPFPRREYLADCATEQSKKRYQSLLEKATAVFELDGQRTDKASLERAYKKVGRLVVNQADLLVALWDGLPAEGKGGTGEIVEIALTKGIPVVQIDPHQPKNPNLLSWNDDRSIQSVPLSDVITLLRKILQPPQGGSTQSPRELETTNRIRYFNGESWPQPRWWQGVYCQFVGLLSWNRTAPATEGISTHGKEKASGWPPEILPETVDTQVRDLFHDHYAWADGLAIHYADRYRSAFVLAYLLSALAVLLPLVSHFFPPLRPEIYRVDLLIACELAIIIGIGLIVWTGWKKDWHQRWIDYRLLAETLRVMRFLLPIGKPTPQLTVPAHDAHANPANTWVNWHAQAIEREAGLLTLSCNRSYLDAYRQGLISDAGGILTKQMDYHAGFATCAHRFPHCLHLCGTVIFITILVAGGIHLLEPVFEHVSHLAETTTLLAAFLPALGASLAGILTQGEFERIARRSTAMAERLGTIVEKLSNEARNHSSESLGHLAETAAQAMITEVLDWRVVFLAKPLGLPT